MPTSASDGTRADNLPLAIGAIVFTVLALSLGDALIKLTSGDFPIWQVFVIRSLIVLPVLVIYLTLRNPGAHRRPKAAGWTILRSFLLVAMWVSYYLALPRLDLSVAAAAYYTIPLFLTLFSALLIGETVSKLRWFAVLLGFIGVLLVLRPEAGNFSEYALLPLLAAVLYALAMILTRSKCRDVHPVALSAALNLAFIATGAAATALILISGPQGAVGFAAAGWAAMGAGEWGSMALLAGAVLIGSVGAAIAYQNGPPAIIGVFDFAYVGFAVIWGFVFFAEVPGPLTLFGTGLVVVAGVLSLRP